MEYAYTVAAHNELQTINKNGIRCGEAGTGCNGYPMESKDAEERGWEIPSSEEMFAPRVFIWKEENLLGDTKYNFCCMSDLTYQEAKQNNFKIPIAGGGLPMHAGLRFPAFLLDGKEFPDGRIPDRARHYVIFPNKKEGEVVVPANGIQIRQNGEWVKLSDYLYEPPVAAPVAVTETAKPSWLMTEPLIRWNGWTSWTVSDSFEHAFAFGRTGSAKSSTLVHFACRAALLAGYGCLFLTTKKTDTATYRKWIETSGRANSLVVIDAKRGLGCNLIKQELDYSAANGGEVEEDATENIVRLFQFVSALTGGTNERRGNEDIWDAAAKQLLRNALNVVYAATGTVDFDDLIEVVESAPQTKNDAEDAGWRRKSRCAQLLETAEQLKPEARAVKMARKYFLKQFPGLAPETRSSVTFNFSARWADLLARDPLRSLFFSKTDYSMDILLQGAVILVDLPVDEKSEIGRLANGLARWAAQRVILRRADLGGSEKERHAARPVAIVWDECQKTLCASDVDFQATAREQRCLVVAATQTIGFLRMPVGNDLGNGFIANFNTRAFYQNQDPDTNQYMADAISKITVTKTVSVTRDAKGRNVPTRSKVEEYAFPPQSAQKLKTGGERFDEKVTAIFTQGGHSFGGKPGMKTRFIQSGWRWGWFNLILCLTAVCAKQRPAPDFRHLR